MTGALQIIDAAGVARLVDAGRIQPGDCALFTRIGPVQDWFISRVQHRLLDNLYGRWPAEVETGMDRAAEYVHAACVLDSRYVAQMTSPRACIEPWGERFARGGRLLVRRPRPEMAWEPQVEGFAQAAIVAGFLADVAARRRYPFRELLIHWLWSWGLRKLVLRARFRRVFASASSDVCSGRYWHWCRRALYFRDTCGTSDARPEAWYPARLAASARFETIGEWEIG